MSTLKVLMPVAVLSQTLVIVFDDTGLFEAT